MRIMIILFLVKVVIFHEAFSQITLDKELKKLEGIYHLSEVADQTCSKLISFSYEIKNKQRVLTLRELKEEGLKEREFFNINGFAHIIKEGPLHFLQQETKYIDNNMYARERHCKGLPFFRHCSSWKRTLLVRFLEEFQEGFSIVGIKKPSQEVMCFYRRE
jgi:hypothetical protein